MASVKSARCPRTKAKRPDPAASTTAETTLVIGLHDPGMTPLLRAGLGGLAAAATALPANALPAGAIRIEPDRVALDWSSSGSAGKLLEALFAAAFRIDRHGLIDLPGSYRAPQQDTAVRAALTDALRRTFLQHGKSATKEGKPSALTIEIDGQQHTIGTQRHSGFIHQDAWRDIAKELDRPLAKRRGIGMAGWANPGAATRHVAFTADTGVDYPATLALCACFAITGCISLCGPGSTGILIVPEPADLTAFAQVRGELAPYIRAECYVGSAGDGALAVAVALRAALARQWPRAIAQVHATTLSPLAWVQGGQKVRIDTLACRRFAERDLDAFAELTAHCPPRQVITKPAKRGELPGCWTIPSNLRGFVAGNLAQGRAWFAGFVHARTRDDPPRWLHRFWRKGDDELGALRFPDDQKGLIAMTASLDEAERLLVTSIHTALRQRFGAIGDENQGNPVAFKKRCQGEREKWRLAFAGARTHEQVRHSLAELWSRAQTVRELQGDGWHTLQPLLRSDAWEAARDLALVALATYKGKGDPIELAEIDDDTDQPQ